jgi:probable rRNA maturation factor
MIHLLYEALPDPDYPLSRRELTPLLERLMEVLELQGRDVEVKLVGDREMAELNLRYLGCHGPTNVLSFPSGEGDEGLGLVVLSVDTLAREVLLYGQDRQEHMVRLLAHAFLHLAGFDHGPVMDGLTEMAVDALGSVTC